MLVGARLPNLGNRAPPRSLEAVVPGRVSDDELLSKPVWTDADFEQMGWHDATVHAIAFQSDDEDQAELLIDLDYIVAWVDPVPPDPYFTFMVSPATLVFENVWSMEGDIEAERTRVQIEAIERHNPERDAQRKAGLHRWLITGEDLGLDFFATGFRQHFRARPIATPFQWLTLEKRDGFSFARPTKFPS
jgi:hypothetical protein